MGKDSLIPDSYPAHLGISFMATVLFCLLVPPFIAFAIVFLLGALIEVIQHVLWRKLRNVTGATFLPVPWMLVCMATGSKRFGWNSAIDLILDLIGSFSAALIATFFWLL